MSLLGITLAGKGVIRAGDDPMAKATSQKQVRGINGAVEGIVIAGHENEKDF